MTLSTAMAKPFRILSYFAAVALPMLLVSGVALADTPAMGPYGGEAEGKTLGAMIENLDMNTTDIVGVLSGMSYMCGLVLGMMGILKLKQYVENPNQVTGWEPVKRFTAGGAFLALPTVMEAVRSSIEGEAGDGDLYANTGWAGKASGSGLDAMIVKLMEDVFIPLQAIFGWFGYIAGIILVMIGISRLLKSEQDGPRGPTGIGTIMTFVVAGCLFSINSIIAYFTGTLFETTTIATKGKLQYTDGLTGGASDHVHAVISSVIAFAMIIGWVSIIRGLFILRGVSEGNSQASMMGAMTHLIGGALAINLGPVIMAVQSTLGITSYGITFN